VPLRELIDCIRRCICSKVRKVIILRKSRDIDGGVAIFIPGLFISLEVEELGETALSSHRVVSNGPVRLQDRRTSFPRSKKVRFTESATMLSNTRAEIATLEDQLDDSRALLTAKSSASTCYHRRLSSITRQSRPLFANASSSLTIRTEICVFMLSW